MWDQRGDEMGNSCVLQISVKGVYDDRLGKRTGGNIELVCKTMVKIVCVALEDQIQVFLQMCSYHFNAI